MKLDRETIAQIFSMMPTAKVRLVEEYVTTYIINEYVVVSYYTSIYDMNTVSITVHGTSIDITYDDTNAFLKWLSENNDRMREEAVKAVENEIAYRFRQYLIDDTNGDMVNIQDYV